MTEPVPDRIQSALRGLGTMTVSRPAPMPDFAERALARARQHTRRRRGIVALTGAVAVAAVIALVAVLLPAANPRTAAPPASTPGPFASARQNVLLLGSDEGPGRIGPRPDTIIVASIDTRTGDTTMFGLPRGIERAPFPPGSPAAARYPDGFVCSGGTCTLSALWAWANDPGRKYYPGDADPGLTATRQAAEQLTGLAIDQTVVVTMRGLQNLVQAVGGVTVNVTARLPIGGTGDPSSPNYHRAIGGWIEPGRQHLDGYHALWYVRSRWSTDDFSRMARQQCVLRAVVEQANDDKLSRYPKVMAALASDLRTSIPVSQLPDWVELATKMRDARISLVGLIPPDRANPDVAALRGTVADALRSDDAGTATSPATSPANDPSPPASTAPATDFRC